jgi:hypothetical protein
MDPENCDIDLSSAVPCLGKAGSITIHHVARCTVRRAISRGGRVASCSSNIGLPMPGL